MNFRGCLLVAILAPTSTWAQASVIDAHGDPSVRSDTIYALANGLPASGRKATVILFKDAVIQVDATGRGTRTYRLVTFVKTAAGAFRAGGDRVSCDPTYCRLRLNWARVVRPDGTIVTKEPRALKEDQRPPEGDRGYAHEQSMMWFVDGAEPGTIVDESYTEEYDSLPRGMELPTAWQFSYPGVEVKRARLVVDAADSLPVIVLERNAGSTRSERRADGRRFFTWTARDVASLETEPFAPDTADRSPAVYFHTVATWREVGEWYQRRSLAHLDLESGGLKRYAEVTHRQPYLADTIDAIYRYVVQGVQSLYTPPARTGFIPWRPDHTIEIGYGDSQDKSALLVAMLRRAGVSATYVLAVRKGWHDADQPSPQRLSAALVRFVRGGDTVYADPDSRFLPPGVLPRALAGALAIAVPQTGPVTVLRLPEEAPVATAISHLIVGAMDTTGAVRWRHTVELSGQVQVDVRRAFAIQHSAAYERQQLVADARGDLPGSAGDSLVGFDAQDTRTTPSYSFIVQSPKLWSNGSQTMLPLSFADFTPFVAAAEYLEQHQPRALPIAIEKVVGDTTVIYDLKLTLPPGWTALLPADLDASGEFGTVVRKYSQEGRILHITQRVVGASGAIPPDRVGVLVAWLRRVTKYRAPYIVIAHGAP